MSQSFSEKLDLVLKVMSMSRARLASELCVDKSVVGRWVTGAGKPSAHNLARLSALIAEKQAGFTSLDWDRDTESLADLFGVKPAGVNGSKVSAPPGLPIAFLDQIMAASQLRGSAYTGLFRSTRPYAGNPGRFLHDHLLIRQDDNGLLRFNMGSGGVFVDGWLLTLHSQLFVIGNEFTSGSLVFGIFHGVNTRQAEVIDGLILIPILDTSRTPTATAMVLQRIADLTDDPAADEARFKALAVLDPMAPEGSVPADLCAHLARDIGPTQLALGGDWLLRAPLARALSRGFAPG